MKNKFLTNSLKSYINLKELGLTGNEEITRKTLLINNSSLSIQPDEDKTVIATVTTTDMDHDNEVIYTKGIDVSLFTKIPSIYYNHDYQKPPIAKAVELDCQSDYMNMKIKVASTPFASEIWELVKGGYVKGNSVGVIIKSQLVKGTKEFSDFIKEKNLKINDKVRTIVKECLLLESSICSMPCNSEALMGAISSKSIKISDETLDALNLKENKYKLLLKDIVKELYTEIKSEKVIKVCKCDGCTDDECICTGDNCKVPNCECNGDCNCLTGENDIKTDVIPEKAIDTVVIDVKEIKDDKTVEIVEITPIKDEKPIEPIIESKCSCPACKDPTCDGKCLKVVAKPIEIKILRYGWDKAKEIAEAKDLLKGKIV